MPPRQLQTDEHSHRQDGEDVPPPKRDTTHGIAGLWRSLERLHRRRSGAVLPLEGVCARVDVETLGTRGSLSEAGQKWQPGTRAELGAANSSVSAALDTLLTIATPAAPCCLAAVHCAAELQQGSACGRAPFYKGPRTAVAWTS